MLEFWESLKTRESFDRRCALKVGTLGLASLSHTTLLGQRVCAEEGRSKPNRSVIHVFLGGGPSHIDTFDMKPSAPLENRGEFKPIVSSLPGMMVCEHLPFMSRVMDRVAVLRSVSHAEPNHLPASHWVMTGYRPTVAAPRNFNPYCGAVVSKLRGANVPGMPAYVGIPRKQIFGGAAYLGTEFNPFTTVSEPNAADFRVRSLSLPAQINEERLNDRNGLRRDLDRLASQIERTSEDESWDSFTEAAVEMVTSPAVRTAFDIQQEPTSIREFYGRTITGQRCLLARRLVEAGATFVTVLSGGEWDTHANNFDVLKKTSLPLLDRALAALVTDIYQRGLDDRVLVVVSGEFGRTATINKEGGRDHWPGAMTLLFAGGGMKVGQVIGATDSRSMYPTTRPYSPGDVLATIYDFLGISTGIEFRDPTGRPVPLLPEGNPIAELKGKS